MTQAVEDFWFSHKRSCRGGLKMSASEGKRGRHAGPDTSVLDPQRTSQTNRSTFSKLVPRFRMRSNRWTGARLIRPSVA